MNVQLQRRPNFNVAEKFDHPAIFASFESIMKNKYLASKVYMSMNIISVLQTLDFERAVRKSKPNESLKRKLS